MLDLLLAADVATTAPAGDTGPLLSGENFVSLLTLSALEIVLTDEVLRREMVDKTPLKRLGEPEDIALAALYLASDAASFVTGKVWDVDGGLEAANLSLGLPDL